MESDITHFEGGVTPRERDTDLPRIDRRVEKGRERGKKRGGKRENKAGYTANTSCGRVGRGGNARFHIFRLVFTDGPTDRRTDRRTDVQRLL